MIKPDKENIKRVKISKQRQISIPKEYYDALNLENEAFVEFTGKSLILRPVKEEEVDFSEYILRDLMKEGYSGEELIVKYKEIKSNFPTALDRMIEEVRDEPVIKGSLGEYLDEMDDLEDGE